MEKDKVFVHMLDLLQKVTSPEIDSVACVCDFQVEGAVDRGNEELGLCVDFGRCTNCGREVMRYLDTEGQIVAGVDVEGFKSLFGDEDGKFSKRRVLFLMQKLKNAVVTLEDLAACLADRDEKEKK